jgi:molybdenum cofactor synthesis domain-containing protein
VSDPTSSPSDAAPSDATSTDSEARPTNLPAAATATAIVVGNEILTGKIVDANLSVLARTLRGLGVRLVRAVTILDERETIAAEVQQASRASDWVFTSGGVGPTHDDVTIDAVAAAFGEPVEVNAELDAMIRKAYGDKLREGHLLMARVPRGAQLVRTREVPWPAVRMRNVWMLPGVPEIFAMKMQLVEHVLGAAPAFHSLAVYSSLDEGHLKPLIDAVVAAHPAVDVGSYPQWTEPVRKTKLTFDGRDRERCEAARSAFVASLPDGALVALEG